MRRIVDPRVLEPAHLLAALSFKGQELGGRMDMMTRNLLLIALVVQLPHARASGLPVKVVASQNAIDTGVRDLDVVISR